MNKKLCDEAFRIMVCFLGAVLLLVSQNEVCICIHTCTLSFSGKENNELKTHKVDPGQLGQFPTTLSGLGGAMGHS